MSAFLFKQTEPDGAQCARAARAFGRGESRASRTRTRTQAPARAGLAGSRQGGGKRGGAGRRRGLAGGAESETRWRTERRGTFPSFW